MATMRTLEIHTAPTLPYQICRRARVSAEPLDSTRNSKSRHSSSGAKTRYGKNARQVLVLVTVKVTRAPRRPSARARMVTRYHCPSATGTSWRASMMLPLPSSSSASSDRRWHQPLPSGEGSRADDVGACPPATVQPSASPSPSSSALKSPLRTSEGRCVVRPTPAAW